MKKYLKSLRKSEGVILNWGEMEELLRFFIENGKSWIISQRNLHRSSAEQISSLDKKCLQSYFQTSTLDIIRISRVPRIENPEFYNVFVRAGQPIPLDFSKMAGITFIDTVLIVESEEVKTDLISLLFHECVHVVQYQILGVNIFIEQYVYGWARNSFNYFAIPLEKDAYELQHMFEVSGQSPFSVEIEVRRRLAKSI